LTIPGINESLPAVNYFEFIGREAICGRCAEFKPCEMGMQISCSVDTEVPEEDIVRGIAEVFWRNISVPFRAEGVRRYEGTPFFPIIYTG
jgi:hypothetical protein